MKKTITFDTGLHKVVPIQPPVVKHRSVEGAAFVRSNYRDMLAAVPDTLPGVVAHSGEPCAYANGDDILSMQCGNTAPIALSAVQSGWHKTPMFTHPPAQPDTEALNARITELEAARIAYASEFQLNADGEPDVGSIHQNIRSLKAQIAAQAGQDAPVFWYDPATSVERRRMTDGADQVVITGATVRWGHSTTPLYVAPPVPANAIAIVQAALEAAEFVVRRKELPTTFREPIVSRYIQSVLVDIVDDIRALDHQTIIDAVRGR